METTDRERRAPGSPAARIPGGEVPARRGGARRAPDLPRVALVVLALLVAAGCGRGERSPLPGSEGAPPTGDAAISTPKSPAGGPIGSVGAFETDQDLPLKLEGIGSKAELDRALARIEDPDVRASFESGFRSCFVRDRSRRRYEAAVTAMQDVLQRLPDFAPAYRVLAYATFNLSFDMAGATAYYEKAVEADPDYGEAHYALSFMLTQFDMERGRKHFERAMELGIPDERKLGEKFYPDRP